MSQPPLPFVASCGDFREMADAASILKLRSNPPLALTNNAKARAYNNRLIEQTLLQVEELRRKTSRVTRLWRDNAQIERGDLVAAQERRRIRAELEQAHEHRFRQAHDIVMYSRSELDEIERLCQTTQSAIHRYEQLCDEAVAEWERLDSHLDRVVKERDNAAPRLERLMNDVASKSAAIEAEMQRLDDEIVQVEKENDQLRYQIASESYEQEFF